MNPRIDSIIRAAEASQLDGIKKLRSEFELYSTPDWCIEAIFEKHSPHGLVVLEPGCNTAPHCAIAKKLGAVKTVGMDIRKVFNAMCDEFIAGDFLKVKPVEAFDMVAMNPPFSLAVEFVNHGMAHLKKDGRLICLQRVGFLSSRARGDFWDASHLSEMHVLRKRPSFTGEGKTDSQEYAYFVFTKRKPRKQKICWI